MHSLYKLAIAAVVTGSMAAGASAATVQTTFDLSKIEGGASVGPVVSLEQDGLKVTFSRSEADMTFFLDYDGLGVVNSGNDRNDVSEFNLTFDHAVKLISYKYGYLRELKDDLKIKISGVNGSVAHDSDELNTSLQDFSTQFIANANEALSFVATGTLVDLTLVQLRTLTVEWDDAPASTVSAVPLPGSALALISGLGGLMALRGRRRNA